MTRTRTGTRTTSRIEGHRALGRRAPGPRTSSRRGGSVLAARVAGVILGLLLLAGCGPGAASSTPATRTGAAATGAPASGATATGALPSGAAASGAPATGALPSGAPATGAPATGPATEPVRLTLGIYSGRPDPTWFLTAAEVADLDRALATLATAVGQPPAGGLGYHGFTIERPGSTLVAYRGAVAPPGEGRREFLADPARTVERLLAETARPHVTGNELAEVERALAAP